jgi:hypothetical protein
MAGPAAPDCTGMQVGECCLQSPGGTVGAFQSAGTLTITDGAKTLATLTTAPYVASSATTASLTWAPGSTIKVSASGGTVDAFDLSVVAPSLLAGVKPAFGATGITVTTSADLVVTWTKSVEACSKISFGVSQLPATPPLPYIGCVADDSAGTLTVPAALLAKLTAKTGTAFIQRVEGRGVNVGNASVKLVAIDGHYTDVTFKP